MTKILTSSEAIAQAEKINGKGWSIVIAGGCFDILHKGHVKFLSESKEQGKILFVLLESDENIKKKKGEKRPINNQILRAKNLKSLGFLDYIVGLNEMTNNSDYDTLLSQINPKVITATNGDKELRHKKRQAKKINARLVLFEKIKNISTSKLIKKYGITRSNPLQH